MNAANNLSNPSIIEYTEFYNVSLDHMDLMQEYYNWQNPGEKWGLDFSPLVSTHKLAPITYSNFMFGTG